jgi:hypothetical protein
MFALFFLGRPDSAGWAYTLSAAGEPSGKPPGTIQSKALDN